MISCSSITYKYKVIPSYKNNNDLTYSLISTYEEYHNLEKKYGFYLGFNEDYFTSNSFIIVYMPGDSSSVKYSIKSIINNNEVMNIKIEKRYPRAITLDYVVKNMIIEFDKEYLNSVTKINVEFINVYNLI